MANTRRIMASTRWNTASARLAIALTGLLVTAGCADVRRDSVTGFSREAPELPPIESLVIDLSFFSDAGSPGGAHSVLSTREHWTNAALRVTLADLAVVVALAVPVATWSAAAQQSPIFDSSDGRWHWRFTVSQGGHTYSGDLSGVVAVTQSAFEMRLTQPSLGLDRFLWYEGAAPVVGNSGFWQFYDHNAQGESSGRIDWAHGGSDESTVRFSGPGAGEAGGNVLTYTVDGTTRRMTFLDGSTGNLVEVEWDALTGAGYITADGYNDGAKSCWDADLNDVACPA